MTKNGTTAKSNTATLTVKYAAPTGVTINGATSAKVGDAAIVLTAVATGNQLTYKWSSGENNANVTVPTNAQGVFNYTVTVSNEGGQATASIAVTIGAADAPTINTQPMSQTATVGDNVTFSIATEAGCTYQWYKNGVQVGTGNTYTINGVSKADDGAQIYCDVTKNGSTSTSSTATLTVNNAKPSGVSIDAQGATITEGESKTFTVNATGEDLSYQWYKDGQPIAGETGSSLTINDATQADSGNYTCEVSNDGGSTVSNPVSLTVNEKQGPDVDLNIFTRVDNPLVGEKTVYEIEDADPDMEFTWEVEGGEVVDGQGGDRVSIIWNTEGEHTIKVTPSLDGVAGRPTTVTTTAQKPVVAVEAEKVSVIIYPNPTVDVVNIETSKEVEIIRLYDLSGRQLMMIEGSNQISVNELPAGTYLMQIKVENEIMVERVVVK